MTEYRPDPAILRLGPDFFDPVSLEAEARRLIARIKDTIGLTTRVDMEPPGGIERSVGKARRVIDRRPKE